MLHISDSPRYLLYSENADMRKSFHGLAALVKYKMQTNVLSGDVFIFISKRRNAIKLIRWDADGFAYISQAYVLHFVYLDTRYRYENLAK